MPSRTAFAVFISCLLTSFVNAQPPTETKPPQPAVTPGELRSYSTIYSLGFEWDLTGDTNHNAACPVRYRVKGAPEWKAALPLFRVDFHSWFADKKPDRGYNMLAGSILFLQPGTTYEVELKLADPDGGADTKLLTMATR